MSILTHDEIQRHLQEIYDEQIRIYDASRILGSCVVGLANYNLAENMDEVRTVTVYVPTWEELCMVYPIYKEKDNNIIYYNLCCFYYSSYSINIVPYYIYSVCSNEIC